MTFEPGKSGNIEGKPKGTYSEYTRKFLTLRTKAAEDVDATYAMLRAHMEKGEYWAYQLYFKELVYFPRKEHQQVASINLKQKSVEEIIKTFIEGLGQIEHFNSDEIIDALKTLISLKLTDTITDKTNEASKLSDEQLKTVTELVIDMTKTNDGKAKDETDK